MEAQESLDRDRPADGVGAAVEFRYVSALMMETSYLPHYIIQSVFILCV